MIIAIAVAGVVLIVIIGAVRDSSVKGKARAARFCTKHMIAHPIPGGPERLVWVYGQHRSKGNRCDGPENRRAPLGGLW